MLQLINFVSVGFVEGEAIADFLLNQNQNLEDLFG
jgi:hypothetical protein